MHLHPILLFVTAASLGLIGCASTPDRDAAPAPPEPRAGVSLRKAAPQDVFETVTFRRETPERSWRTLDELPRRLMWGAGPGRSGSGVRACQRPDDRWRVLIQGRVGVGAEAPRFAELLDHPSLEVVSRSPTHVDRGFACELYDVRVRDGRLRIEDHETGEVTFLGEHASDLPTGVPEVVRHGTPTEALVRWPGGEQGVVDLATRKIVWSRTSLPGETESARRAAGPLEVRDAEGRVREIPSFGRCLPPRWTRPATGHAEATGRAARAEHAGHAEPTGRALYSCRDRGRFIGGLLWDPATLELVGLDQVPQGDPDHVLERPYAVDVTRWAYAWDDEALRYLRQDDGPLRWFGDRAGIRGLWSRRRDGLHETDGVVELRRYDLDEVSYEVLHRFEAGACPGKLGAGWTVYQEGAERFLSVVCVTPKAEDEREADLQWSQVFDLSRGTTWRTPLNVASILADGTALVTDLQRLGILASWHRVWEVHLDERTSTP